VTKNQEFKQESYLFASNSALIEELYEKYLQDPSSVDPSWSEFFKSMPNDIVARPKWYKGGSKILGVTDEDAVASKKPSAVTTKSSNVDHFSSKVKLFVKRYRETGHYAANLDPLGLDIPKTKSELKLLPSEIGFSQEDMERAVGGCSDMTNQMKFSQLVRMLERTYAATIGYEFSHLPSMGEKAWLHDYIESANFNFSNEDRVSILQDLVETEGLEEYLHVKFPGAKRFSVEGGDASVMSVARTIKQSGAIGVKEVVIGMAHRGRLNTLTKVMGKPYSALLAEFAGIVSAPEGFSGDVKYHMGYSNDITLADGSIMHLTLTPNPSHLEAVNPVNEGRVRAKQDLAEDRGRKSVLGILIHGDAAFCGQGIVFESLAMSVLAPYYTGGTIHMVVNNQVGFTANPSDGRVGRYPTEIAKSIQAPVIHVNGDDAEAVAFVSKLALDYRQKFGKNIIIDIVCYRKYGHNEGDEPFFTQSVMYNVIKTKNTPAHIYADKLVSMGVIKAGEYDNMKQKFKERLDFEFEASKNYKPKTSWLEGEWKGFIIPDDSRKEIAMTGVPLATLKALATKLCSWPADFPINSKIKKLLEARKESIEKNEPVDWATAETLAFATLLEEGFQVRITGQDAGRGTFSHRHSVLHSQKSYETYIPLNNLSDKQAMYEVADSNLSEYGVLGFEYGYSMVNPRALVIWEAQFGDFSNGAQIIFDQFISSAETKWQRLSGLVVLLPHGFEGQGPEHSSARIERYLQLCAGDNMQVCCPSTPASIFHLLRRQLHRKFRKPLIIMSPKSLLRHKMAVSDFSEINENSSFKPVIDDANDINAKKLVICAGKVYYDLVAYKEENKISDVALVRLEQYYPFPESEFAQILIKYKGVKEVVWCQEEPKNMGAWHFIRDYISESLAKASISAVLKYCGREESATPATGYLKVHNIEQAELVKTIFN
jgi:2-oxoglutarate dehydrogenase E1 component